MYVILQKKCLINFATDDWTFFTSLCTFYGIDNFFTKKKGKICFRFCKIEAILLIKHHLFLLAGQENIIIARMYH